MRRHLLEMVVVVCTLLIGLRILHSFSEKTGRISLPSSKLLLEPVPGNPQPTNSFPSAVAISPDGKYLALLNHGYGTFESDYRQSIAILDIAGNKLTDFPDARLARKALQTYFYGLAFSADGSALYASMSSETDPTAKGGMGTGSGIAVFNFSQGKISPQRFIRVPGTQAPTSAAESTTQPAARPFPAGIAVCHGEPHDRLLVASNLDDQAVLIDSQTGTRIHIFDFRPQGTPEGSPVMYPLAAACTRRGEIGYVGLWNGSAVVELDLITGGIRRMFELRRPAAKMDAGSHPTALLLSPDEKRLYVALANTDEIAVIDRSTGEVFYLSTKLPGQQYGGNFPLAMAITPDGQHLFVANASSDAIAVFDHPQANSKPRGFIPTQWYPTALAFYSGELFIATGKGQGTGPNKGYTNAYAKGRNNYISSLLYGSLARIRLSDIEPRLPEWTEQVLASNLMRGNADRIAFSNGVNPIKHVIYIIKENRSYDQVLGDLGVGDGDPSLVMFGEDVTPNEHRLARQFGVLDNFYDSGEVSGDGHVWSTAAITTDYTEQTWQIDYRSKERTYDYEGVVDNRYPILEKIPDVNEPKTGYLWGNLARHKVSYRHYGEYISTLFCGQEETDDSPTWGTPLPKGPPCPRNSVKPGEPLPDYLGQPHGSLSPWPWAIPLIARNIPVKPELVGHYDPRFPDFNLDVPDQLRADEFLNEFNEFVWSRERGKDSMPQFILLRLPNDHNWGTRPKKASPAASVADNDLAFGRVVEAISHSPYWKDTAIFVLEDDAQSGADHVDAHRSIAWVISRFSPAPADSKPFVDHTFYTTVNMIHTMESLLGVPPMNNNDSQAAVMAPMFTGKGDQPPFVSDSRNRDNGALYKTNPPKGPGAQESLKMDFSHADAADAATLNAILWKNRMGDRPFPRTPGARFRNLRRGNVGN